MVSISTYNNELLDKLIDDMGGSIIDQVIDFGVDHSSDDEPLQLTSGLPNVGATETCVSNTIVCDPVLTDGILPAPQQTNIKPFSTNTTSDDNRDLNDSLEPCDYSNDPLPANDLFNGALAEIENEFEVNDSIDYGEEIHRCSICGEEYNWKQSLQRHMLTHIKTPKPQVFQCKLCHEKRSTKSGLKHHMAKHTVTMYECSVCKAVCSSSEELSNHLKSHSKSHGKRFVCEVCLKSFSKKSTLAAHESNHSELEKSLRAAPGPTPIPARDTIEWNCGICNVSFPQERLLIKHRRRHAGKRAFECDSCDQSFSQETHLIRHRKTHEKRSTDEIYDEKYHKETIKHEDTLYQDENLSQNVVNGSVNVKAEEQATTYQCQTCSKYFGLIDFVGHDCKGKYRERPFKCDFCSKAFKLSSHLVRHKATVHVVKPEYGVVSGYSSAMANSKRQRSCGEKLSHTREKPSLCTYCNKYFSRRHDLKRHQELKRCKMMTMSTPPNWAEQPIVRARTSPSSQGGEDGEAFSVDSESPDLGDDFCLADDSGVDDILTNMKIDPDSLDLEDSGIDDLFGFVESLVCSSSSSLMDDSSLDSMPESATIKTLNTQLGIDDIKQEIDSAVTSVKNDEEGLSIKLDDDSKSQNSSVTQCSEYNHDFISSRSMSLSPLSSGHDADIQYFPLSVAEEVLANVSTELEQSYVGLGAEIDESQLPFAMETVLGDDSETGDIDVVELALPVISC